MVLRISCESSLVYLRKGNIVEKTTAMGRFAFKGLVGLLDNLLPNSGDEKKLRRVIEGYFLRRRLQPQTKIILK